MRAMPVRSSSQPSAGSSGLDAHIALAATSATRDSPGRADVAVGDEQGPALGSVEEVGDDAVDVGAVGGREAAAGEVVEAERLDDRRELRTATIRRRTNGTIRSTRRGSTSAIEPDTSR